ncbi:diacylglycerol O-acyltransferase [Mycobacterium sp. 852002-51152_SCH6134967]|uniref:WS/DGAT/MGAT family O-acyltransferase n=1 Tax=Mycobacterium sp. 852002-51152_SCH6134967 TaxID=1834096 RepID=UPI000800D2F9|nr:wax ester/triacylglycerol synthase family O-acyltransferase [Mycobacterium sp. 852002-51152_SCH6134967]OBF97758.1 diacylglycerol O-acyltransferase [Mycobacterium sp. 852002-51152_SCH6134967]
MKRLSGWDSLLLSSETPNVHQHTLKIAVVDTSQFEGEPTFDAFLETFRERLPDLDPFRYELVDVPLHLHRPVWRQGADIDFGYHVRKVAVPDPYGRVGLDALIGQIASTPLDRSRPLWELYYAEGLAENRVAVIGKVHHALADGVASANLMARAMEWPGTGAGGPRSGVDSESVSAAALLAFAVRDHLRQLAGLPGVLKEVVVGAYRLQRRARARRRHPELAERFKPPPTFLNRKLSAGRAFATATLSLDEVRVMSKQLEATVNDVVLAIAAGGLRTLLIARDGSADDALIASVPAATDTSPDRITGNELSTMLVSLPVQIADPLERLRLIRTATRMAKEDNESLGPATVGKGLRYVPPAAARATFRWMSRREAPNQLFNLIVSNVPGPRERGRIAGAVVTEIYSVGPLAAGSAMNMTVWSYVDQLNVSVLCDDLAFDDVHTATDAFVAAFAELRAAAGLRQTTTEMAGALPQVSVRRTRSEASQGR